MMLGQRLVLASVALSLGACKVGPDYVQPELPIKDEWRASVEAEMSQEEPDITKWWESLDDPTLTDLIRGAEVGNLDLRISVARVAEARALRGIAKGDLFPDLVLEGAYSYTQFSENSPLGQIIAGNAGEIEPFEQWDVTASSFWEIDLFGRIRRRTEAATAQFEATIEDYRDVLVSLYAEIGLNYVDVRSLQARLDFARQNVVAQTESLELTRDRFQAGLTSALDVAQAEANLATTESTIPTLQSRLNAALNRLAVLLGRQPGALHDSLLAGVGGIPEPPPDIMTGVPADILRRRPDVRRAERLLAAQTALIGVATADLYPTFSIAGFVESVAGTFTGLFGGGETIGWGIIPGFRWDLFKGGKIRNNIRAEEARTDQTFYAYQQTILLALAEVEDALVAYDRELVRRERLREAAAASQRAVDLVRTQYISGLTNFQNLLDTQRSLFNQQDELADSEGQVVQNLVTLNRALGGGWSIEPEDPDRMSGAPRPEGQENGSAGESASGNEESSR